MGMNVNAQKGAEEQRGAEAAAGAVEPAAQGGAEAVTPSAPEPAAPATADARANKMLLGVVATLVGGAFWGFSGTSASYLFDVCHIDTMWLLAVRQVLAGILFMAVVLATDRQRLVLLWKTPHDRRELLVFILFGMFFNQFCYLSAVRLTNAGTATVLQCLQLIIVMAVSCLQNHRRPRKREVLGVALALGGTFLIATGGDPTSLKTTPLGLLAGLMGAVSYACLSLLPSRILPKYGSPIVTGNGMLISGLATSLIVQPWAHMPQLSATGLGALAVFVLVGSFLAYMLYMEGVKDVGSVRASLLGTIEPVSATVTSALMLGTVFLPTDIAGFAMIIAMMFLTV